MIASAVCALSMGSAWAALPSLSSTDLGAGTAYWMSSDSRYVLGHRSNGVPTLWTDGIAKEMPGVHFIKGVNADGLILTVTTESTALYTGTEYLDRLPIGYGVSTNNNFFVNDAGQIAGNFRYPEQGAPALRIEADGNFTVLDSPGARLGSNWVMGMNASGDVVGFNNAGENPILWKHDGTVVNLRSYLRADIDSASAIGISNAGHIIGSASDEDIGLLGTSEYWMFWNDQMYDMGNFRPTAVNSSGVVIGIVPTLVNGQSNHHVNAIWTIESGVVSVGDLLAQGDPLKQDWSNISMRTINDRGDILANYGPGTGGQVVVLSNMVPEPGTYALMLLGLGMLSLAVCRGQRTAKAAVH